MITSRGTKENEESCCAFCKSCSLPPVMDKSSNFYRFRLCKTFRILDGPCTFFSNLRTKHTKSAVPLRHHACKIYDLSQSSDRIAPEGTRRQSHPVAECVGKSRHVLISNVLCDDFDRKIGRLEQMLRPVDAHQNDILMRRVSALALEQSGKVVLTHVHTLCDRRTSPGSCSLRQANTISYSRSLISAALIESKTNPFFCWTIWS